jgi:hypothetical protein
MDKQTFENVFDFTEENIQNYTDTKVSSTNDSAIDAVNTIAQPPSSSIQIEKLRNETIKLFIKMHQSPFKLVKTYLVSLILISISLSSYMVINTLLTYFTYEVTSTERTIFETPAVFPKVTISAITTCSRRRLPPNF